MSFVLDASVTLSWCLDEIQSERTQPIRRALETTPAVVPSIWPLEVANTLLVSERRGRIRVADSRQFLRSLSDLPLRVDADSLQRVFGSVLSMARIRGTTVYDASYLELAVRLGLPLATVDDRLKAAAKRQGIPDFEG